MRHDALLDRERAVLVMIDVQEAYRRVLDGWQSVVAACGVLLRGATLLGLPILVTEQYPRGLGHTAPELASLLPPGVLPVEKVTMSCAGSADFRAALARTGRRQVLVAGIETHACVNQTVHDLLADGYQVHAAADATSSRRARDVAPAWAKMLGAGMQPTGSEQALLELVRTAEAAEFRDLQRLLKDAPV